IIKSGNSDNITYTLFPMIKALTDKGIAVATITFKHKKSIKTDILDQIKMLCEENGIDTTKVLFIGHSFGGYMLTQLLVDPEGAKILNKKCPLGIVFYAPAGTEESWTCGGWIKQNQEKDFLTTNGFWGTNSENSQLAIDVEYPFITMNNYNESNKNLAQEMRKNFNKFENKIYIFYGTADLNTLPTQVKRFKDQLTILLKSQKNGETRLTTIGYPYSFHHIHRVKEAFSDEQNLKQLLDGYKDGNLSINLKQIAEETKEIRKDNFNKFMDNINSIINGKNIEQPEIRNNNLKEISDILTKIIKISDNYNIIGSNTIEKNGNTIFNSDIIDADIKEKQLELWNEYEKAKKNIIIECCKDQELKTQDKINTASDDIKKKIQELKARQKFIPLFPEKKDDNK
ncbi:MAG: hypothetical protein IJ730_02825, partial [Alphaproteobacteria bacterium]|nr:hypothetical protein [Alphaproteobacteria bacterium]